MQNFEFYNSVDIIFGKGQIAALSQKLLKNVRVLMTYGGGSVKRNGVYDQVKAALKDHVVFEFSGIEPNPHYETLMKAVEIVKKEKIDFLLAVGGGSVIDGTKFIAAAACFNGEPWDILEKCAPITKALPLGTVLTLPATGSEMNSGAVITKMATQEKLTFRDPLVFPKFSILDPETTYTLPEKQTANGIVDTFVHVVEQYIHEPIDAPLQDRFSEGILLTLIEEAPKVFKNPKDYNARANIMWCATLGLNGLIGTGASQDWAIHLIGHEITAMFGVDHGRTLAVVLPGIWHVMREKKRQKLLQYGERVLGICEGNEDERIDQVIEKTRIFFESLGVKTRLKDYDISKDAIPKLMDQLKKHEQTMLGRMVNVNLEICRAALEYCV